MKFKVVKGAELFDKLQALGVKTKECNDAAYNLSKSLGFKGCYKKSFVLAGGLYGLIPIDGEGKKEGYVWAFSDREGNAVMPAKRKVNKDILDTIKNLPVVEYKELNDLVNYKEELSHKPANNGRGGTSICFCPAISFKEDLVLLDVPVNRGKYKPPADMIEILESEFNTLSKQSNKKYKP